jgi:uncharacterized BrkB/YihY/UPF0761 family membrane protein
MMGWILLYVLLIWIAFLLNGELNVTYEQGFNVKDFSI